MPFPTSDETAGSAALMHYESLEDLLKQRAPEYADRIERPEAPPFYLKVRLDACTSVLLNLLGRSGVWDITDPQSARSQPRVWAVDTPRGAHRGTQGASGGAARGYAGAQPLAVGRSCLVAADRTR